MSETEPILEPVPVTKDNPVVNGNGDVDLPPPEPELNNGLNGIDKPNMDISNGIDELNGDHVADGGEIAPPVNGGLDGDTEDMNNDEQDLMGGEELPPPPAVAPELPPPPPMSENDGIESSVDPIDESNVDPQPVNESSVDSVPVTDTCVDPVLESSVDPEVVDDQCVDDNDDLMNVSDNEEVNEDAGENVLLPQPGKLIEAVSEEELVSTSGLKEELEEEVQNNQENELKNEGENQLIDFGAPEQPSSPVDVPAPPTIEVEQVPVQADVDPQVEPLVEAIREPEVEVEPTVEEPKVEPVAPEPVMPESEVEIPPQEEQVTEPVTVETDEVQQPQVGYAEPDIIVDNKPAEEEVVESPPPPPPPLVDETPPPPPPSLDDSIPLRRVSGGSSPSKESNLSLESPTPTTNVAVVPPQPEQITQPSSEPVQPASPVKVEPPVVEPATPPVQPVVQSTQPIAIVAPQVQTEAETSPQTSPPASPPGSPSSVSIEGEAQPTSSPQVSQKINKKNFKNKIRFGVDLVEASLKQLNFLKAVNNNGGLYEEWLFKKAIRRYEAFWLPLAAEHKKESLAAPLDIEWVWHCHMLAPVAYEADCKNQVGLMIEHKIMSDKDRTKALEKSKKFWTAKYPKEPFEIELVYREKVVEEVPEAKPEETPQATEETPQPEQPEAEKVEENTEEKESPPTVTEETGEALKEGETAEVSGEAPTEGITEETTQESGETTQPTTEATKEETPAPEPAAPVEPAVPEIPEEGYEQRSSYDIFRAITRQRVFFYQTSLPHFHDKQFLKAAQKRYQRFMFLKHQNPSEVLVPCYDIDLMWHSHQLHPTPYKHDTTKVLGQTLVHDDSVNNRAPGSTLVRADQKTRDLWKDHFGDNLMTFGAMFRGEPPVLCEKMSLIDPVETYTFSTKKATVNLDKVQVEGLPEQVNKYSVKLAYGANERDGPLIKQFKGNKKKIEFENTKKGLAHFVFDTKEYDRIKFNMSQQIGFACAGHDEEIGQQVFNLMPVVESIPKDKSDASALTDTVTIDIDEENSLKANFSATIEPPKQGPTMLFMCPGNFETRFCIMPEQIVQMWGPIPLPRLPSGQDNHCVVASHKFVNHTGEITFTCRVIHSLPLLMSAIQVMYQSRMAAVAHLVGSDQIPLPAQLSDSKKIFSLNPADGQRAVLIKNQTGDWGLIRGQWTGFRKHQPAVAATKGKKAKKEVAWNPGTLSVSFYKCATGAWQHLTLGFQQENFKVCLQDANIDLKTGTIEINSDSNEVAENLALAFSVAMLHVLCQPRYLPPPPPEPIPVTVEAPPPSPPPVAEPEVKTEEPEKPAEASAEAPVEPAASGEGQTPEGEDVPDQTPATEDKPQEEKPKEEKPKEEKPKSTPVKTPKSPTKEPPTPNKKVKEIPPIPTYDLYMVLAAGYNIDTPTNDNIQKQFGPNACAGCVAIGMDVGIGMVGEVATETAVEAEVAEAGDAGEEGNDADNGADDNVEIADGGDGGGDDGGMEADGGAMDGMGDAGGAACAAC